MSDVETPLNANNKTDTTRRSSSVTESRGGLGGHLNKFLSSTTTNAAFSRFVPRLPSFHPVSLIKLRLVLGVWVLHSDPPRQNGGHVVPDSLVLSLLFSLFLHFAQLDACSEDERLLGSDWKSRLGIKQKQKKNPTKIQKWHHFQGSCRFQ